MNQSFVVTPIRIKDPTVSRLKIFGPDGAKGGLKAAAAAAAPKSLARLGVLGALVVLGGCAVTVAELPPPRPIVIHSGARIRADHAEMTVVNEWVTREQLNIEEDPSFMVVTTPRLDEGFPWDGLDFGQDSVMLQLPLGGRDGSLVYQLYGHMHLMVRMGRQEEWLPEAPGAVGYELERAIVKRISDAWILGRTVFDTQPFAPLDEMAFSSNAGFVDAFIFTARPNDFATSRAEWARANPGEIERYREWFVESFNREPPGIRAN